jgi:hypothetical protein
MAAVSGAGLGGLREGVGGALMSSNGASGKKKAEKHNDDGGTMSLKKACKSGKLKKKAKKKNKKKGKKKNSSHGGAKAHAKIMPQENDPPEEEQIHTPTLPSEARPVETPVQMPFGTEEPEATATETPEHDWQIDNMIQSTGIPFPDPARAPYPPGYADPDTDIVQQDFDGGWISKGIKAIKSIGKVMRDRSLRFNSLESGYVSVVVDDAIDVGEKIAFRGEYGFRGTRYLPSTIAQISGGELVGNVFSKGSILTAVGASLAANAIDYGF